EVVGAFRWIRALSPFRRDVSHQGKKLELATPTGMVALDDRRHWAAESADGAVIWTSVRENRPEGGTPFWIDAVTSRLGADFASAEVTDVGAFKVARFVDGGEAAYRYLLAIRAAGDDLEVVEVYYPTPGHEERYGEAVKEVLTKRG